MAIVFAFSSLCQLESLSMNSSPGDESFGCAGLPQDRPAEGPRFASELLDAAEKVNSILFVALATAAARQPRNAGQSGSDLFSDPYGTTAQPSLAALSPG
jgi:hypothetical protein